MLVKKIKLENFRNYESLELEFSPDINYIYGNNGQGKTNIVEAVYMFAALKSHRVNHDFEMIKDGCEFARIEMDFANRERDFNASVVLSKKQNRKIKVNDIVAARNSDLIGKFNQSTRVFSDNGICPTLTASNTADNCKILVGEEE